MRRAGTYILAAVLVLTLVLTLGPIPVRPLDLVTGALSGALGQPAVELRPTVEAVSNVVMFAALALALLLTFRRLPVLPAVLGLVAVSGVVELVQALWLDGRHGDVRDVALNGLGSALGGACSSVLRSRRAASHISRPRFEKVRTERTRCSLRCRWMRWRRGARAPGCP